MDIAQVYNLYVTGAMVQLTLDDIIITTGTSHQKLRRYCKEQGLEQLPITPGLMQEVKHADEGSRTDLAKQFNLSLLEVNICLYSSKLRVSSCAKAAKAAALRKANATEADLIAVGLPTDPDLLAAEITAHRKDGKSLKDLSAMYSLHTSRISQLDRSAAKKPRLTPEQVKDIKTNTALTVAELAKKHNTTRNTVYVLKRRG